MATHDPKTRPDLGAQAVALAEQLGRLVGTIEGSAEAWLNRPELSRQLTNIRDNAVRVLDRLRAAAAEGRAASKGNPGQAPAAATARQADPSRAPGKRRRKPAPSVRGARKSNEAIPKMRTATTVRQRRKSYA